MAITVNGSGTITGVSVGGLPDGIVDTDMLAADAVTDAKQNLSGAAKAWVNFNGIGTVAIRDNFNVSSITDNGTGNYTVNFTNSMGDTNYATIGSLGGDSTMSNVYSINTQAGSKATSSFKINSWFSAALADFNDICIAVFGD